jgi:hypothetical protein
VSTPSLSLAFQTLVEMMAMVMVLVLNTKNLRERSALMVMLIVFHEELERQRSNMMMVAIIDLKEHERTTICTIYERK